MDSLQELHDSPKTPDMTLERLIHLLEGYAATQDENVYTTSRCSMGEHVTKISGVWRDSHGNVVIGYKDPAPVDLCVTCQLRNKGECDSDGLEFGNDLEFGNGTNVIKCTKYTKE